MDELKNDIDSENKKFTIEECLKAIDETQNKITEEEDMKKIIRETLLQTNSDKNHEKIIGRCMNGIGKTVKFIGNYIKKEKHKKIITRIMVYLVMCLFIFSGTFNKVYANNYVDDSKMEDSSIDTDNTENTDNSEDKTFVGVNKNGKAYSYDALEISEKLKKGDYSNSGNKIVFLTFDDGTSTTVTPKILNILDQYDVKATFFLMGKNIEDGGQEAKDLVKKEFDSGHAMGNHSYSHEYSILYPGRTLNLESFKNDYEKNSQLLKSILGDNFSTRVIRCPGGYMSWKGMSELDGYLKENDMTYIDWNALSGDSEGKKKNADELAQYAIETSKDKEIVVILMHDTYGKEETVKSLPKIIEYFKNSGYEFKTLA